MRVTEEPKTAALCLVPPQSHATPLSGKPHFAFKEPLGPSQVTGWSLNFGSQEHRNPASLQRPQSSLRSLKMGGRFLPGNRPPRGRSTPAVQAGT